MKKLLIPALLTAVLFAGCTNTGAFLSGNQTIVNLNEGNYSIAAINVTGESESAYVFGFSYSTGLMATTFAIARVEGSGQMYAEALEDLWSNYESVHGSVSNQKLALANVRYDTDILNLFFYSKVRLIVRADVVEFE
jgi:hypothetical protein